MLMYLVLYYLIVLAFFLQFHTGTEWDLPSTDGNFLAGNIIKFQCPPYLGIHT